MTLSHPNLRNWPLAAVALAMACSVSAQVSTPGTSDPATTSGTTAAQPSTSTGTTGSATGDTTYGNTSSQLDTRNGAATNGSANGSANGSSTQSGWMGRPMYSRGEGNYSIIPYSTQGYVGVNAGQPKYDTPCVEGFVCNNRTTSYKLYTGGMFTPFLGGELAYVNMGRAQRAGGRTEAHGINLSLVGRMPVGAVNLFAKAGATYGRTKVGGDDLLVTTGTDKGWGGSYGLGVGFDVTRASSIVLEWERHDFRFRGLGREHVDSTSLGYVHRF